jgi:sulfotransferase family protein
MTGPPPPPHGLTRRALLHRLRVPDENGRDLTLLRTRWYRFSGDLRHYVLAEELEERLLAGGELRPATLTHVRECLAVIRASGRPLPFDPGIAGAERIDVQAGLAARGRYAWQHVATTGDPRAIAVIVGAPRSGTSHLYNLLARTGTFSYFTTASCWAWPVRNLRHPARRLFTAFGGEVLAVDNKRTRIIPGLVMPGEAEDIWARALPVYRHICGHRYDITQPRTGEPRILQAAARAHTAHFGRPLLLVKSPFNSFRIQLIEALWSQAVRYVHILRGQRETADSMRRNGFEFCHEGHLLTAEQAWRMFTEAVREHAPADRLITVTHAELLRDPDSVIARVSGWLGAHAKIAP